MIKNVVFDLGNVLLSYDPYKYLCSLGYSEQEALALEKAIFKNKLWGEVDRGAYNFKEAIELFSKEFPCYAQDMGRIFKPDWFEILKPMEENVEYMLELKEAGYKIYILSNYSAEGFAYIEERNEFFKMVDGKVISAHVNYIKPEREIYEILLNNYALLPEETVFIDDLPGNIAAAAEIGIHGIVFENLGKLRKDFEILCN